MPSLKLKFNHGYHIANSSGGLIGVEVLCKNGGTKRVGWLGFIPRDKARELEKIDGAIPVKLVVQYYSLEEKDFAYLEVPEGKYLQGCLVNTSNNGQGVYGVVDLVPRIV